MKAIVYHGYGSARGVLTLQGIDRAAVEDDEVLGRVRAASINPYDWHLMEGKPYVMRAKLALRTPRCTDLGGDLAGGVEEMGKDVTELRVVMPFSAPSTAVCPITRCSISDRRPSTNPFTRNGWN